MDCLAFDRLTNITVVTDSKYKEAAQSKKVLYKKCVYLSFVEIIFEGTLYLQRTGKLKFIHL